LKTKIAVAALFTAGAFLTPAYATSVLFTASSTLPSSPFGTSGTISLNDGAGSITAYGFDGVFSVAAPPTTVSVTSSNQDKPVTTGTGSGPATLDVTGDGLGLKSNDTPYIGPGDAIVLDFSNVKTTDTNGGQTGSESQVTINTQIDATGPSDWTVYGFNTTTHTYDLLDSGSMASTGSPTFTTSTLYSAYLVGVTNDCGLTIDSVDVQYSGTTTQQTPEPGTFVMAGLAMLGIGVTMKRRNRKA
jgi:hypothetical protein